MYRKTAELVFLLLVAYTWSMFQNVRNVHLPVVGDVRSVAASREDRSAVQPVITMFTTIKDRRCRDVIHARTLANWAALMAGLRPLLFVPEHQWSTSRWKDVALSRAWQVRMTKALRQKIPILTAMFRQAIRDSTTPFVGYANADILFDDGITRTLEYLTKVIDVSNTSLLVVGRRRNANISTYDFEPGDNLTKIATIGRTIPLFHGKAQDYFVVSRKGLPWSRMPDFVVGRNGYDNWLVVMAQRWNVTLIDTSLTITAVHQEGTDGVKSGSTTNTDGTINLNKRLVKGFDYSRGRTESAPFYTQHPCASLKDARSCNPDRVNINLVQRPLHRYKWRQRYDDIGAIC